MINITTDPLTPADIAARLAALQQPAAPATPAAEARQWRYVRPLSDTLEDYVTFLQDDADYYELGFTELDLWIRGIRPGEMWMISGFSHSGKTQVLLTSYVLNSDKPILHVTFDEPAELVLAKLVAMVLRRSSADLEEEIKRGDARTIDIVRSVAAERFANLIVIDKPLTCGQLTDAVDEAQQFLQRRLQLVAIDYIGLLPSESETEASKAQELKRWLSATQIPGVTIQQNSRSGGGPGEPVTITSGRYGGEQEATGIIGVRRKKDWKDLDEFEREAHRHTVSVSIVKNKRPPAKLGEFDYSMDENTGLILPRHESPRASGAPAWTRELR